MFDSEYELQQLFFKQLNETKNNNSNILQEFNARFGNVDIVEVDYSCINNTLSTEQATLLSSYSSALIVAFLHKNTFRTKSYLMKRTGYTDDYLSSILTNLKRENIINEIEKNKYVISSNFKFPTLKFTAYELKLKEWKKAIIQASKNLNFAYKSYIVMPNDEAKKINKKYSDIFMLYNIGLIGVDKNSYYYYIKPKIYNQNYTTNPMFISSIAKFIAKNELQAI